MHRVYAIDKFGGEAINNDSRMTDRPKLVRGSFNRAGGISAPPQLLVLPFSGYEYSLIGFDWLGIGAWTIEDGNPTVRPVMSAYNAISVSTLSTFYRDNYGYHPGGVVSLWDGGISWWEPTAPTFDKVLPSLVLAQNGGTYWVSPSPATLDLTGSLSEDATPGGGWDSGDCVSALFVFFYRGKFGWVPIQYSIRTHAFSNSDAYLEVSYSINNSTPVPSDCGFRVIVYVNYGRPVSGGCNYTHPYGSGSGGKWFKLLDEQVKTSFAGVSKKFKKSDVGTPSVIPTFYRPIQHNASDPYPVKRATYHLSRDFYVGYGTEAIQLKYRCYDTCFASNALEVSKTRCVNSRSVMYSDEDFIGYAEKLNVILVDDTADAVIPSSNGIYVASGFGISEITGDFETASTIVRKLPVGYGVDESVPINVAFSGRESFFYKDGTIFSIGASGFKNIGQPERSRISNKPLGGIYYNRLLDHLLLRQYNGDIDIYDSLSGQWSTLFQTLPADAPRDVPVLGFSALGGVHYVMGQNRYRFIYSSTADLEVVFENVDMQLPGIKKRIHTIRIPHRRAGATLPSVYIRRHGSTTWTPCTTRDHGESIEARCPTIVSDAFDIRILALAADTEDYTINPPIIISYEPRERIYDAD